MKRNAFWKWLILGVMVFSSLHLALPLSRNVQLGLDLKGGTSFTVQIDQDALMERLREESPGTSLEKLAAALPAETRVARDRTLEVIRNRVDGLGIAEPSIHPEGASRIVVQLPGINAEKRQQAERAIQSVAFLEFRMVHDKNEELVDGLFRKNLSPPGYRLADADARAYERDRENVKDEEMDAAFREQIARFHAPAGYDFMLERARGEHGNLYRPYFVERRRQLTGDSIKSAGVDFTELGQATVVLRFDGAGARRFAQVTTDYAPGGTCNPSPMGQRHMAIVLDGALYSAPVIRESIHGGRAEISGSFTSEEAAFLANVLQAGSLRVPVRIVERRIVDPTLGADSIRGGVQAGLYGCAAVLLLMAIAYRALGLVADVAMLLNAILLPLGLVLTAGFLGVLVPSSTGHGSSGMLPVLTLPGIAGIALTVGMAVDANVLIFERIREEWTAGKSFRTAVKAGFSRALTAILDSNVTTVLTAVILFVFGSGPVRGYAVTLTAGILVSMYTAVVVSKMLLESIPERKGLSRALKMRRILPPTRIDFIGKWKVAMAVSLVVIVGSWMVMGIHGQKDPTRVLGIDFTGGSALTMQFQNRIDVDPIRQALTSAGVRSPAIQYQKDFDTNRELLQVKVRNMSDGKLADATLRSSFPAAGFQLLQQDDVGPQIGAELKSRAGKAMVLALGVMLLYIAIRFEIGFAVGAVSSLLHDVLVTVGVCHLLGFQLNMTVLAALMTIIGYSVNDTIVIFDRIREDLKLVPHKSFMDICNQGINETLSRTFLTNLTTLISVLFLVAMGGGSIRDFSVTMLIGMVSGTYSTVYIATPVVLLWYRFRRPTARVSAGHAREDSGVQTVGALRRPS